MKMHGLLEYMKMHGLLEYMKMHGLLEYMKMHGPGNIKFVLRYLVQTQTQKLEVVCTVKDS
jgi:hypothetical protein